MGNISELAKAYDETLVGWSRAMDFRDRETEGHTKRVTELTIRLAQAMNVGEAQLLHIRWGVVLPHDMGKLGISDNILLLEFIQQTAQHTYPPRDPQTRTVESSGARRSREKVPTPIRYLPVGNAPE